MSEILVIYWTLVGWSVLIVIPTMFVFGSLYVLGCVIYHTIRFLKRRLKP